MNDTSGKINCNDFSSFERMPEYQKSGVAKDSDEGMRIKYLTRHPVMNEVEFFSELDRIANEILTASEC